LPAGSQPPGIFSVKWKQFRQMVLLRSKACKIQHCLVMRSHRLAFHRPLFDVVVAVRHHGRTPNGAESADGQRWWHTHSFPLPWNMVFGVAIGIIGTENEFLWRAAG